MEETQGVGKANGNIIGMEPSFIDLRVDFGDGFSARSLGILTLN